MGQLPEGGNDVVGLYPNIPHEESLASLRRFSDARTEKKVTTENLVELAENVLTNIFQFNEKTLKQLRVQQLVISLPHRMQFYLWLTLRKEF